MKCRNASFKVLEGSISAFLFNVSIDIGQRIHYKLINKRIIGGRYQNSASEQQFLSILGTVMKNSISDPTVLFFGTPNVLKFPGNLSRIKVSQKSTVWSGMEFWYEFFMKEHNIGKNCCSEAEF